MNARPRFLDFDDTRILRNRGARWRQAMEDAERQSARTHGEDKPARHFERVCPDCHGNGRIWDGGEVADDWQPATQITCTRCNGEGVV